MTPRVAVIPSFPAIEEAVVAGGGVLADDAKQADAIVWLDTANPDGLGTLLKESAARWIQLPLAGVERFFEAGVVDPQRTWTCPKVTYALATAEQALALMLAAARRLHHHVRARSWASQPMESHRRLNGTTAVIVGTGGIGTALAEYLTPLRVRILAVNRSGVAVPWAEQTFASERLADVVHEADWLVLAPALTPQSRGMVEAGLMSKMKPEAWVINVGRGGLIETDALVAALREGRIAGAALDVTDPEPLPDDHPLWAMENVIITSHTANTVAMALPELVSLVEQNVRRFASGERLLGLIDPLLGY